MRYVGDFGKTNSRVLGSIRFFVFSMLFILPAISAAQERAPILEKIAKAYGLDSYGQIEAIRYTWNGEIPGIFKLSHAWEWEPKTGKISFQGTDKEAKPAKSHGATPLMVAVGIPSEVLEKRGSGIMKSKR